ncbi:hypothetical protein BJF79_23910 [Actinomadura sp. CNU-125]|nr:hypothetical protein BJF79_23910 [Actinomadura sp. CNU-125]
MTLAIAAAMAGAAVEASAEPARAALLDMARRVRERFRGRAADERALERATETPDEPERVEALEGVVRRVLDEDPEFGAEIESMWNEARTSVVAADEGVVNMFNGRSEKVVQMRDVNGQLNI